MDIKEIIKWSLHRWWWFAISLALCGSLGIVYYLTAVPQYQVGAVLMLRQTNSGNNNQDEMLQMMGVSGNKIVGDEVQVLTSRDLMGRVVDSLDLCTSYRKRYTRFWKEMYPSTELSVALEHPVEFPANISVRVRKAEAVVKIKYDSQSEQLVVTDFSQPIQTIVGKMQIHLCDTIQDAKYKVTVLPRAVAIDNQLRNINVSRLSRESNVITLSAKSACPGRTIATINTLLDLYNQSAVTDKNRVAVQTEQFLTNRITIVAAELTNIEEQLEEYKRVRKIADLNEAANTYQQKGLDYQQQVAELESELSVLDFMAEQLANPDNRYTTIPGSFGINDKTLSALVQDYNARVAHRNQLLQNATEQNPIVQQESEQIDQKRVSIQEGIARNRQTLSLRKNFVFQQQNQYDSRLASIPETERYYLELSRSKQTKEKQYLYLIEKQEENAMLLVSEAIPAKVVERAQIDPTPVAPKLKIVGIIALLLGLLLPLCVYFFGIIRKEYL